MEKSTPTAAGPLAQLALALGRALPEATGEGSSRRAKRAKAARSEQSALRPQRRTQRGPSEEAATCVVSQALSALASFQASRTV